MQLKSLAQSCALTCVLSALLLTGCASTGPLAAQGPGSSQTPYLLGENGWTTTALMTVGDRVNGYAITGITDGISAYLNENNELVVLMNHELGSRAGVERAHGAKGSFVSEWRIDPKTMRHSRWAKSDPQNCPQNRWERFRTNVLG